MAVVTTRQTRVPPSSGNTGTGDGNPLSSHFGHDMVYALNNLTKTCNYFGFVGPPDGQELQRIPPNNSDDEIFLAQVPTVLPRDGARFCWTLGIGHDSSANVMVIDDVNVYISPEPYTAPLQVSTGGGPLLPVAFDATKVVGPYHKSSYSTPITTTAATVEKYLIDMSTGTRGFLPFNKNATGPQSWANLIVTLTRHTTPAVADASLFFVYEFSWWVEWT